MSVEVQCNRHVDYIRRGAQVLERVDATVSDVRIDEEFGGKECVLSEVLSREKVV